MKTVYRLIHNGERKPNLGEIPEYEVVGNHIEFFSGFYDSYGTEIWEGDTLRITQKEKGGSMQVKAYYDELKGAWCIEHLNPNTVELIKQNHPNPDCYKPLLFAYVNRPDGENLTFESEVIKEGDNKMEEVKEENQEETSDYITVKVSKNILKALQVLWGYADEPTSDDVEHALFNYIEDNMEAIQEKADKLNEMIVKIAKESED